MDYKLRKEAISLAIKQRYKNKVKMEEVIEVTRTDLIAAYKIWNNNFANNPEDFNDAKEGDEAVQVDYLLECLKEVRK